MTVTMPDPLALGLNVVPTRRCGPCQLCCKLLPVKELAKAANQRCTHQRHGKGCAIYTRPERPDSCGYWSCAWLLGLDTDELRRPDLSRFVIDVIPDFVDVVDDEKSTRDPVEIVQVWVDPRQRDAWNDPALRAFLERRAAEGKGALIRFSASGADAITVFAPPLSARFGAPEGTWIVNSSGTVRPARTGFERFHGVIAARRAVQP